MKTILKILCIPVLLICLGCSPSKNVDYEPSIKSLASNETLVMKLRACHNGCTKGVVKFRNGKAILGKYSLILTKKEIIDLDGYFLSGRNLDGSWRCSLPIIISFRKKKGMRSINSKSKQIYPCSFLDYDTIDPESLVRHLTETPTEIPFWRLLPEEQSEKMSFGLAED